MQIGILEAETLKPEIVARHGSYRDMFERLLAPLDASLQFRSYAVDRLQLPSHLDECDAYLVTGSRFSAYDDEEWIQHLQDFIRGLHRQRKKCIGICFGHQVIAQALGGKVEHSGKGWGVGVATFVVKNRPSWLQSDLNQFSLLASHQDQVVELPPGALLIAGNDFCPFAAFAVGNHVVTFQGHPEFTRDYARYLIEKRRDKIGTQRADRAIASLQESTDELAVATMLLEFLGLSGVKP